MPLRLFGVLVPDEGQVLHVSGFASGLEHAECGFEHRTLRLRIVDVAVRTTERVLDRSDALLDK